ncbi:MAG: FAD-binding oxidoreductase [Chloroflexi bacterium]|nr:FAD-binding oxidoreductase [Chloroflexota bacterium]
MEYRSIQDPTLYSKSTTFVSQLPGKVFFPSDRSYDALRQSWNLLNDKHPAIIVLAENQLDVIKAVSYAHQQNLPIAVQATGHRGAGSVDGAILINTSRMKELRIDPQAQTAWIGAGVKWGEVLQQAQQHGLAPLLGSTSDVGAVGYTLGGGMGWLARKYGMCVDSVLRMDVVTLDGTLRHASPEENSDLFWALRGGDGFGVVTGMEICLYPVSQVYAGNLFYPSQMAKDVFRRFRQWASDAPDELTCSVVLINYPPLPQVPPMLSGKSFVQVRGCYAGAIEDGEKLLEYWRTWQTPAIDDFKARPFNEADAISMDPVEPMPALLSGEWLSDLSEETAEALIRFTLPPGGLLPQGGPPAILSTEVRLAGGAISRIGPDTTAYSNRSEKFIWYSVAVPLNPQMGAQIEQHLQELRAALGAHLTGKVYMNFLEGDELRRRTPDGYSEKAFQRLRQIKTKYDPDYRLISSFDIQPM